MTSASKTYASRGSRPLESYQMQMVNDPLLSPLLIQMAVFSAIDSTERTMGAASFRVTGEIDFYQTIRIDTAHRRAVLDHRIEQRRVLRRAAQRAACSG